MVNDPPNKREGWLSQGANAFSSVCFPVCRSGGCAGGDAPTGSLQTRAENASGRQPSPASRVYAPCTSPQRMFTARLNLSTESSRPYSHPSLANNTPPAATFSERGTWLAELGSPNWLTSYAGLADGPASQRAMRLHVAGSTTVQDCWTSCSVSSQSMAAPREESKVPLL